ncbi:1760_t:CDS:2 [Acaulospora colombiana]|uniref:1760_t:CDS:1 n=1 Tax=Acaulospora colombiana TaxID=27376 RepID=A0ACA9NUD8_9GLOM|nr:1760_t:CDS:2 [Acaulospora colombiana]
MTSTLPTTMTTELANLVTKQLSLEDSRQQRVAAIERMMRTNTKAKISRLEQPADVKPFLDCVNKIRGQKENSELLLSIIERAKDQRLPGRSECKVKASKIRDLVNCEPCGDILSKVGFRLEREEMQEIYRIPDMAARPGFITGIKGLEGEVRATWEREERERLAEKGAKEQVLDNIEKDKRRRAAKCLPQQQASRFQATEEPLGSRSSSTL